MRRSLLWVVIGLGAGVLLGAALGWLVPLRAPDGEIATLHRDYRADYAVMVGAAYAADGDWDRAQARLGRLAEPDPAAYVARLAEQYIAEGRTPADIRYLVALAARFGYTTPPMQPYLPAGS